jgi:putative ABC transport system permease protein
LRSRWDGSSAISLRGRWRRAFDSELYRVPLVVNREVYAYASLVVLGAAMISGLIVRRRIDRLDMIEVLKTRE